MLPANSTLTNGTGTFSATLTTAGSQTLTATDTLTASITGIGGRHGQCRGGHAPRGERASAAVAGTGISFTVKAEDQFNNMATGYAGSVHFSSSDVAHRRRCRPTAP